MKEIALRITASGPIGQILDADYLGTILREFDAYYGFDDFDLTPPDLPERPDPTLWRRVRGQIMRWAVLLVVRTDHAPDWLSDTIVDYAFEVHDGH